MKRPTRLTFMLAGGLAAVAAVAFSLTIVARAWSKACGCGDVSGVVRLDGGASFDDLALGGD
jgi:hypothetical protein